MQRFSLFVLGLCLSLAASLVAPRAAYALSCAWPYTGEQAELLPISYRVDGEEVPMSEVEAHTWTLYAAPFDEITLVVEDETDASQSLSLWVQ